jgi:tyrosine-protein kinase Etk/Wzc
MNEEKIDIREYISIILRRKWLILAIFIPIFLFSMYHASRKPPVYEAKATIIIKQLPTAFPSIAFGSTKATEITNHTFMLMSRTLMDKVAGNFTPTDIESIGVDNKFAISNKVRFATTITPVKSSDIIEIKCKTEKPYTAALFANTIAETYIQFNIEDKRRAASGIREFAETQMKVVEEQLKKAEDGIRDYQKIHKVLGLKKETEEFIAQLTESQTLYEKAKIERKGVEKNLEAVKSQLTIEQKEFLETSTDISLPLLEDLKRSLSTLEKNKASLLIQEYGAEDPKIKEINVKIEAITQKMNEIIISLIQNRGQIDALTQVQDLLLQSIHLRIQIEVAKEKEKAYQGILNQYERKFRLIPDNQIELARLERQRTANEKVYMMLIEKVEEARISEASEIGTVSMLDRAMVPKKQIWRKRITNLILGFIMGVVVSLGVAFVIEYFDTSIKGIKDIEKGLKIPILTSIPSIKTDGKRGEVEDIGKRLITHYKPRSPISESYRSLRTNLQFASVDGGIKTVIITSPAPREGKTLTASNLAIAQAQAGRKTLLIDTDLRKPMIHNLFNLEKKDGISRVLTGELKPDAAIKKTDIENLYVITSGPIPPNPSELLGSKRMKAVLKELKDRFDIIVLDSPPMIAVTDPVVLGQEVDGMVLVVRSGRTTMDIAEKSKSHAEYAKIKLLGCVLNDVDVRHIYGTYNYYYYHYYYYTEEGEKKKKRRR